MPKKIENIDEMTIAEANAKLNINQKRFVSEYILDGNAQQAAIRAGYSATSACNIGPRMLKNKYIARVIDSEVARFREMNRDTRKRVMNEILNVAFSRITDVVEWDENKFRTIPSKNLTDAQAASISSVMEVRAGIETTVKVSQNDRLKALKMAADLLYMKDGSEAEDDMGVKNESELENEIAQIYEKVAARKVGNAIKH